MVGRSSSRNSSSNSSSRTSSSRISSSRTSSSSSSSASNNSRRLTDYGRFQKMQGTLHLDSALGMFHYQTCIGKSVVRFSHCGLSTSTYEGSVGSLGSTVF